MNREASSERRWSLGRCLQHTSFSASGAGKPRSLNVSLRHEVARLIVWHAVVTRPVVPSAVSYEDVRKGHDPYSACGHGTYSHPTGTRTVRGRCLCQHQAERGLDWRYGEPRCTLDKRRHL